MKTEAIIRRPLSVGLYDTPDVTTPEWKALERLIRQDTGATPERIKHALASASRVPDVFAALRELYAEAGVEEPRVQVVVDEHVVHAAAVVAAVEGLDEGVAELLVESLGLAFGHAAGVRQ